MTPGGTSAGVVVVAVEAAVAVASVVTSSTGVLVVSLLLPVGAGICRFLRPPRLDRVSTGVKDQDPESDELAPENWLGDDVCDDEIDDE